MIKTFTLSLLMLFTFSVTAQKGSTTEIKKPFSIGETFDFYSDILEEERTLNVYLPFGYNDVSKEHYPVIYLLDGSADEDFIHIAGLVQFGSFPWINMLPETIVVGIANVDRKRDFTFPSKNEEDKKQVPTSGGAEEFIRFIEYELQPLIEREYRTSPSSTIIGQSLGGLLATQILFKKPDLFDNYFIISPSLWWDDESLLNINPKDLSNVNSIYTGVGKEGEIMERLANELYAKILDLYPDGENLFFRFFEAQNHGDVLHLAVYDAFEKIFREESKF